MPNKMILRANSVKGCERLPPEAVYWYTVRTT